MKQLRLFFAFFMGKERTNLLRNTIFSQIQYSKWRSHKITQLCVESVENGEDYLLVVEQLKYELTFLEKLYLKLEHLNDGSGISS